MGGTKILLKVGHYGFDGVVGLAFDQVRRASFTAGQVAALERMLEVIGEVIGYHDLPDRRKALRERAFAVGRLAPRQVSNPRDAVNLACRTVEAGASLLKGELGMAVRLDLEELIHVSEDLPGGQRVREDTDDAWEA